MYEMQEKNFCNMAVSEHGGIRNRVYKCLKQDIGARMIINDYHGPGNAEQSSCIRTLLNQAAANSVKLLRRSLKCLIKQDKNQIAYPQKQDNTNAESRGCNDNK